jgi:hypothetical protein
LVWLNLVPQRQNGAALAQVEATNLKGATAKSEQQVNERQINKSNVEKPKLLATISSPTAVSANKV